MESIGRVECINMVEHEILFRRSFNFSNASVCDLCERIISSCIVVEEFH